MKTLFTDSWQFKEFDLNTSFDTMNSSNELCPVDVPHDWMIWHVKDLYKNSIGFYKKSFNIHPENGHTYIIRFEGVYMDSKIYLNGKEIFEWKYGYSTFDVNLTPYLIDGENELAVSCTYQCPNTRWYSGAGIYRNVYFIEKDFAYLPMDGVYISTEKIGDDFIVSIDSEALSTKNTAAQIRHTIYFNDLEIAKSENNLLVSDIVVMDTQTVKVTSPKLWDINDPNLYLVKTELIINDIVVDTITNPLGFRTIRFDSNEGFFLNDRNVKINGVCQHHDLGALGSAINKVALRRQLESLIEMGVNSVRTSHNMPDPCLMDLADEMGILIFSESFDMWERTKTQFDYGNYFPDWWERDVTSWVRRDRNHPSLFIWSIGNEIYDTHAGTGLKWTILLRDKVRELDYRHNAYIGIGSNYIEWDNAQACSDQLELSGYNYGERLYDEHHKKYPDWCIFGSETASTVQSRGIYHFPYEVTLLTCNDGQCSSLGNCTTNWGAKNTDYVIHMHRDRDFVFGQYLWTGWDYIGEPTPYFSKNSYFGQIDTAGFKKDTYYLYQAEWTDVNNNPMAHLLPYWDFNEGQIIDVMGYSNAPYVELFLNDESLGKQFIDHKHGEVLEGHWKVPYKNGELKLVATDEDGNVLACDTQRSFSDPCAIVANATKDTLKADGEDLIFVEISTVDSNGTLVANARNRIHVEVSGAARLVGLDNGDSTDYEEYKATNRKLFSGKLLAIIASTNESGPVTVSISSLGLTGTTLMFNALASDKDSIPCSLSTIGTEYADDIPLRKIELFNAGTNALNVECKEAIVSYKLLPENTTYKNVEFKALTKDGIIANFVAVTHDDKAAYIKAIGDGEFRLTAYGYNDKDHPEIISELEFSITGLGMATYDPYGFIHGCEFSKASTDDTKLSFEGGVFLPSKDYSYATYDSVDFGEYGSDEVTIPIFSFHDSFDIEILNGDYENGESLGKFTYNAKSIYNTYQANTFKLNRRIKGTSSITFVFYINDRISLHGFSFTKKNKAYSLIEAVEASRITGDSFKVATDAITNIGNNVSIDFDNMNFTEGIKSITVCGCSHNEKTSMHILFMENGNDTRQMIEIPYSEDYTELTLPLESVSINGTVSIVFLPGSNFDLKYFKFNK